MWQFFPFVYPSVTLFVCICQLGRNGKHAITHRHSLLVDDNRKATRFKDKAFVAKMLAFECQSLTSLWACRPTGASA